MDEVTDVFLDERFLRDAHIKYLKELINELPDAYTSVEATSCTVLYFCIVGLDLLDVLDSIDKQKVIDYVYSLQLTNVENLEETNDLQCCNGFVGSHFLNHKSFLYCPIIENKENQFLKFIQGHIAMAYTALSILITLGDDLSRLDKVSLLKGLSIHFHLSLLPVKF